MKKTKIIAMVLGLVTTITMMIPNDVTKASVQSVPSGYTPIYTIEDLYGINDDLNGNYILMNDIDLSETKQGGEWDSGSGWTPIGKSSDSFFQGTLDGNGYRIKNMTCYATKNNSCGGLFNAIWSGEIKNLGLENINLNGNGKESFGSWGGIAIKNEGKIENCYVTGVIHGSGDIGGIAAKVDDHGTVKNCYADVEISDDTEYGSIIGGIVGLVDSSLDLAVENCYSIGTIDIANKSDLSDTTADPLIGHERYSFSNNLYYLDQPEFFDGEGSENSNGKRLTKVQMKSSKCFTGFDFKKTWVIDKNSSYPYPQLRNCMQVRTESIELLSAPDKLEYTTADKLDLTGSELKINYEDDYNVTVPLEESMLSYKMQEGDQTVRVDYNGCKTSFDIKVKKVKESLKITAKKTKLKIGNVYTYKVKYVGNGNVKYSSSNNNVLSIDKNTGKAKARKAGKATITIKAGKITKTIKVIVKK